MGHDKLTIVATPALASIGAWLEQLVAESTGKQGKGVIPVDGEALTAPETYGNDRVFVYIRLQAAPDPAQEQAVKRLEQAGQPVVYIDVTDLYNLGQEFFRWEIATAVIGAILGVNPFDQPDVEASKIETRKITEAYESGQALPEETLLADDGVLTLYSDARNATVLHAGGGETTTPGALLQAHLGRISDGDYLALLVYLDRNAANLGSLKRIRDSIRQSCTAATCLGFGPRFLHSTGQAYKGGPNSGVFIQVTCDPVEDVPVPGHNYTFGLVEAAQARGDFEVLAERDRRVLRVHLGADLQAGLDRLEQLVTNT